jgi:hypothetical protein
MEVVRCDPSAVVDNIATFYLAPPTKANAQPANETLALLADLAATTR